MVLPIDLCMLQKSSNFAGRMDRNKGIYLGIYQIVPMRLRSFTIENAR